ncbi:MAG: hypothetical protein B6D77_15075 [gamma proteobacterium symbiont of Ctena orbiculata]|nr:MAG: hypothetical protein B6D77_15075 [gamma proteobacterium symbiont of Ctena orbiculata]PVV19660.1 MAG: hypothetical protein B6D78_12705 [gamma proteobacterium symbiont of Ctena orbiculata]PVV27295.1 MAG: hypothetical protein B6D79_03175 [gamma proteobacterium symbiont of Ctena orbiculata]
MSMLFKDFEKSDPMKQEVLPFRINSVERLPALAQDESCKIIKQYFDYLESMLGRKQNEINIVQLREILTEISGFIRSEKSQIQDDGYMRMLNRLTTIYAKGIQLEDDKAFTGTAVNFADIMNTVSQSYAGYDYRESVGLMLHYMNRLFNDREESWLEVFEHLMAMPDSHVLQMLKEQHLQEIKNWVEEGVDNLFAIWDEQLDVISNLSNEIYQLDKQILQVNQQLRKNLMGAAASNIIYLKNVQLRQELDQLRQNRMELDMARDGKLELANLLDENIHEFGDRLTEIRRSTQIQLVWDNSAQA